MALDANSMKSKFKASILKGLKREFAGQKMPADVEVSWGKIAGAIADIAIVIVEEITTKATVAPGIPVATAGSPAAQAGATTGPGKIT